MTVLFDLIDTVHDREKYLKARKMSETTDMPVILYCQHINDRMYCCYESQYKSWNNYTVCKFRRGRELPSWGSQDWDRGVSAADVYG